MRYYKIIDDKRVYCPENGTIHLSKGGWISRPSPEQFAEEGWLPDVPPERTLDVAKRERIALLEVHDQSQEVLSFSFFGTDMWINPGERTNYLMTVDAADDSGLLAVPFHGRNIPIADARNILKAVALYAMQVMAVTDAHRSAINALQTIKDVDAYDFEVGYPAKLQFGE